LKVVVSISYSNHYKIKSKLVLSCVGNILNAFAERALIE
jgi:hypothetical protein